MYRETSRAFAILTIAPNVRFYLPFPIMLINAVEYVGRDLAYYCLGEYEQGIKDSK